MKISNISCCNKSDLGKSYSLATPGRFGVPAALNSLSPIKTTSLSTQTGTPGFKYSEEEIKKGALLIYSLDIPGYSPLFMAHWLYSSPKPWRSVWSHR